MADDPTCIKAWPSPDARSWFARWLDSVRRDSQVLAVVAVGSCARNVAAPADLDLVAFYRGAKPAVPRPPLDVDIRCYSTEEAEALLAQGHELLGWAVRFGCAVLEKEASWSQLRQRWAGKVPLPSAARARALATRAEREYGHLLRVGDEDAASEQRLTMLTHRARARLVEGGVYPASRPELPDQLDSLGQHELAQALRGALEARRLAA